ncbi:hypothetical protein ACI65C_004143 [Semiaphis heraclei]
MSDDSDNSTPITHEDLDMMRLNNSDVTSSSDVINPQATNTINNGSTNDNIQNSSYSNSLAVKTNIICSDNQKSECDIPSKNKNDNESLDHNDTAILISDDNDSDWEDIDDNDNDINNDLLSSLGNFLENINPINDPPCLIDDSDWKDIDKNHDTPLLNDGNKLKNIDNQSDTSVLTDDNDSDWVDIDDIDGDNNDTVLLSDGSDSKDKDASSNNSENNSPIDPILLTLNAEQARLYFFMNSHLGVKSFIHEPSTFDDNIVMYDKNEIVEIVDGRYIKDKSFYLVKWRNWSLGFNTWERFGSLYKAQEHIFEFKKKKHSSNKSINIMHLMLTRHIITQLFELFRTSNGLSLPMISIEDIYGFFNNLGNGTEDQQKLRKMSLRSNLSTLSLDFFRQTQFRDLRQWEININVFSSKPKVKVENNIDLEGPPENFAYIPNYTYDSKIIIPDNPPSGCICKKNCLFSSNCCNKLSGEVNVYDLEKNILVAPDCPVFECHENCKCIMTNCFNRVVQNGSKVDVCIYKSRFPGWASKTCQNIEMGQFVGICVGEIITLKEFNRRLQNSLTSIDFTWKLDFNDANNFKCIVDCTNYGNFTRFINHSCEANLSIYHVWISSLGTYFPHLALFANRKIYAGEQLTIDYFINRSVDSLKKSGIKCQCEMKNCKGYFF